MFSIIFLKELKEIIQSSRFTISFAVCSVLIILSFVMGAQNYLSSQAQFESARQENRNQIAANTHWGAVNHNITLPPQPLMALVSGVSNDIGRDIEMRGEGELRPDNTRYNDEPIFAVFRFMDLEFIFGVILSLFAIIFAYDSINGEKIRGTLKLCFSNSLPRASYIAGKLMGSFVGLSIALLIPILIGAALLPVLGVTLSSDEWVRLGIILVTGIAYFGVFLGIGMTISSLTKLPSSSFLICLVIWIGAVLIVPRASVLLAGRISDIPNVDEISAQKSRYRAQLWDEDRPKLSSFSVPEGTPPNEIIPKFSQFMNELGQERQQKIDAFEQRLNEDYQNKNNVREKLALGISRVSPTSLFTLAVTNLSGTSLLLQNRYAESAKTYQTTYSEFMKEKLGDSSFGGGGFRMVIRSNNDDGEEVKPENLDPSEMPQFEFTSASLQESMANSILDLGLLIMLNVVFFGTAFAMFLKYDLR